MPAALCSVHSLAETQLTAENVVHLEHNEGSSMAEHTPYQRKIIERYYKNFDAIMQQRLSELATDLYLADGKKLDRLWAQVESSLRKLEFPEHRIAELIRRRDPTLLVAILKELEGAS
jgi:hypothetical protein